MRIIKTGKILTPDTLLEGHFILEHGGIIEGILPLSEMPWAEALSDEKMEFPPDSVALPGFFDHHAHSFGRGLSLIYPNLSAAKSLDEAGEIIRANLDFPERPVIFTEYDDSGWGQEPDRNWLDGITGDVPVVLRRVCGHKAVANTAACRLLPNPEMADKNGILLEDAALYLFNIFRPSADTAKRAALAAQEECLRLGITGIREIGNQLAFSVWQSLEAEGLLAISVEFYFIHTALAHLAELGIRTGFGGRLRIGGVKVFLDGSIGARTARFKRPYADTRGRGVLTCTPDDLAAILKTASAAGIRVLTHAIGDEAIEMALSVYRETIDPGNPMGHTIEHAEAISQKGLDMAAEMGVVLSVQPNFLQWQAPGGLYEKALGRRRARSLNPFRRMLGRGARVLFGSDSMPPGPQYGIGLAINHPNPDERIEPLQALALYSETELTLGQPFVVTITNGLPGDTVYSAFA
ncbi:MAG: amidohydrolase family protein [candidate division WOR-3 bacterium]